MAQDGTGWNKTGHTIPKTTYISILNRPKHSNFRHGMHGDSTPLRAILDPAGTFLRQRFETSSSRLRVGFDCESNNSRTCLEEVSNNSRTPAEELSKSCRRAVEQQTNKIQLEPASTFTFLDHFIQIGQIVTMAPTHLTRL